MDHNDLDFDLARIVGEYFRLNKSQMDKILNEVLQSVRNWKKIAVEIKIPRSEQSLMAKAF